MDPPPPISDSSALAARDAPGAASADAPPDAATALVPSTKRKATAHPADTVSGGLPVPKLESGADAEVRPPSAKRHRAALAQAQSGAKSGRSQSSKAVAASPFRGGMLSAVLRAEYIARFHRRARGRYNNNPQWLCKQLDIEDVNEWMVSEASATARAAASDPKMLKSMLKPGKPRKKQGKSGKANVKGLGRGKRKRKTTIPYIRVSGGKHKRRDERANVSKVVKYVD